MPHAVTHKDTQPIASHQSGNGHVHFLFSPRAMEALRTSTVPSVAKTPNDSPGRSYMRTFNATPSTYNVPMVSSTTRRMWYVCPASRPMLLSDDLPSSANARPVCGLATVCWTGS